MKTFLFNLIFLFVFNTHADVLSLFSSDSSTVRLIVQGEVDANKLFEALNVEIIEENNLLTKSYTAPSSSELDKFIYKITCNKSKLVIELASCTIEINSSYSWGTVNASNRSASVFSNGFIDTIIAHSSFNVPIGSESIYLSKDSSLDIGVLKNLNNEIFRFYIRYREN